MAPIPSRPIALSNGRRVAPIPTLQNMADTSWAQHAPSLSHLLQQILEFEPVLAGYASGPQPGAADYDPTTPEHLSILADDPWGDDPNQWVTITAEGCQWHDSDGRLWVCSHGDLFAYLAQLPRRLHTFGRCAE